MHVCLYWIFTIMSNVFVVGSHQGVRTPVGGASDDGV